MPIRPAIEQTCDRLVAEADGEIGGERADVPGGREGAPPGKTRRGALEGALLGIPGIVVGLLIFLTIKEPRRGQLDHKGGDTEGASFGKLEILMPHHRSLRKFANCPKGKFASLPNGKP